MQAIVLLVLVGGPGMIPAGHAYWSAYEGWALARETAALRAAGEPVTTADLMQPKVPDDRNAVVLLRKAAAVVDEKSKAMSDLQAWVLDAPTAGTRLPLPRGERSILRRALDESQAAFPLIAEAASRDGIDWGIDHRAGLALLSPDLGSQRNLTNLLAASALLAHERKQDARAVELLGQLAFVSDAVGRQGVLLSHLVSHGMSFRHAETLAEIAPDLAIGDGPGQASPARVRQLIDQLLDNGRLREAWLGAMRAERVVQQDTIGRLLSGEWTFSGVVGSGHHPPERSQVVPYVMGPVMKEDARILMRFMNEVVEAGGEVDDWPAFLARVPQDEPAELNRNLWRHTFAAVLLTSIHRASESHYRIVGYRHLAAAALAARLYALDHDGDLPPSLEALVPRYMPRVPLDTMAAGGRPIRYVPDPERPRVYHVGPNGIDDGGRDRDPGATREENDRVRDEVVYLRRQPRPAAAAKE